MTFDEQQQAIKEGRVFSVDTNLCGTLIRNATKSHAMRVAQKYCDTHTHPKYPDLCDTAIVYDHVSCKAIEAA